MRKSIFSSALILLVYLIFVASPVSAETKVLKIYPQEDNEVQSAQPNSVFASDVYADVGHWDTYNNTMRYYIKFRIGQILPVRNKITSAIIKIDQVSTTWDQDGLFNLHFVKNYWIGRKLTWANQPAFSVDSITPVKKDETSMLWFDITDKVKDPKKLIGLINGFALKKPNETGDNNGLFATSDYPEGGSETRPFLEVTYSE